MIGGRKTRSNKGKKRTPYGPRSRTRSGSKFRGRKLTKEQKKYKINDKSNLNFTPTFNNKNNKNNKVKRSRKVRSNKGKKRTPYGPRSRTR